FGMSNTTTVLCQKSVNGIDASTYVGDIVFAPNANAYTIRITPDSDVIFPSIIEFHGSGVINNSGIVQNLVTANSGTTKASGRIYFMNSASPGENVVITNEDGGSAIGDGVDGGFTALEDSSNAANATFINEGGEVSGTIYG